MTALDPTASSRTSTFTSDIPDSRVAELSAELAARIRGEVRFDGQTKAAYATDGSNYRQVPIGVVVPRDVDDIVAAMAVCHDAEVPVLGRGAGTSLAGQCCNAAVIIDCSKYVNRIIDIDPDARTATVEPGVVLDTLRAAAEVHGLTYGPDPATHAWCTMGGIIGNNSCGVHAVMAGKAVDNLESLDVLTYDGLQLTVGATSDDELAQIIAAGGRRGELYRGLRDIRDRYETQIRSEYPDIPRRVSGYNLDELLPEKHFQVARALVGTESTCAFTLRATVRLVASPAHRRLLVLGYDDIFVAGDAVPQILEHSPIGCEVMDRRLISEMQAMRIHPDKVAMLPTGNAWLMVEFGADSRGEATERANDLAAALTRNGGGPSVELFDDPADEAKIWEVRESALGATARVPGQMPTWEGWEDSAVSPDRVGDYLRGLKALWNKYGYEGSWYGHIGDGCVHTRNNFDLTTAEGIRTWRQFIEEAADLCVSYGGSLSGEHGDGQARGELLAKMYSPKMLDAFREFKALWDPAGRMNPGKVIDAYPLDSNLRLGTEFRPVDLGPSTFAFPDDSGSLLNASMRCVGVGKCRRPGTGDMCPSYQVTREEVHSTRGRARLLFEMLRGEVTPATWRNDDVKEALDLCISCKACANECPVGVDMATYKAEFLSHYYEGRLRPPYAYALGYIDVIAKLASHAPRVVNALARTPVLGALGARAVGITTQREIPRFATSTFVDWFRARQPVNVGGPQVLVWPDTFTTYLTPGPGHALVEVLEHYGFSVRLPDAVICCGRPLYDFGMLGRAKRLLRSILDELRDDIAAGVPMVGIEPSCLAVFRDELVQLFPDDEDAKRLAKQTFTLSEFLLANVDGFARFDNDADDADAAGSGTNGHRTEPAEIGIGSGGDTTHGSDRDGDTAASGDDRAAGRRVKVQGHCHQKAVWGTDADMAVLSAIGAEPELMPAGCCGLAGSFGFEADHHEISMRMGERAAFPAVREAGPDTAIVADGFSCRTQIGHGTDRRPQHLAELLRDALAQSTRDRSTGDGDRSREGTRRWTRAATVTAATAAAWWLLTRRQP